jgi:hypothetical protein
LRASANLPSSPPSQASKVAVLGAAGGIGQPLSLLLKLNPRVSELALYDIRGGPGMSQDIVLFLPFPNQSQLRFCTVALSD